MATITKRKGKKTTKYNARIRIKRAGVIVHEETETFTTEKMAKKWAARRETELDAPGTLEAIRHKGITAGQVLAWYKDDNNGEEVFNREKLGLIKRLIKRDSFADLNVIKLTTGQLISHARLRAGEGAGVETVGNDFISLRTAMKAVRVERDLPLDHGIKVIDDAMFACKKLGLTGNGENRDRRPSVDEFKALLDFYSVKDRSRHAHIPMTEIIQFAIFSSRRQAEICRILWSDLDEEKQRVLIRDIKNPNQSLDTWVHVPDLAWAILQRQPKVDERIFPYVSGSVSGSFTNATMITGIDNLNFHDLRHECISWLFERGWGIPRVANVSGHQDWKSLRRYTQFDQAGDKWEGFTLRSCDDDLP